MLDTLTGSDAARLYARLGWQRVGEIPGYALLPGGGEPCGTTLFYRVLEPREHRSAPPEPASAAQ